MTPIPIEDAKLIAETRDYDQLVIIGRKVGEAGGEHVTTYGRGREHCAVAALMGDRLKEIMRWPAQQFHVTAEDVDGEIMLTLYETNDAGPMKEWNAARTFPIDEAHATELLGTIAIALKRKRTAGGVNAELVHAGLRDGLEASADVEQAYSLAQSISDDVNARLNELADRQEATVATSLLARALTARALLLVAGDWWASMGNGPGPAYHAALRSFIDQAPANYADRSEIAAG